MTIKELQGVIDKLLEPYSTKNLLTSDQKAVKKTEELYVEFPLVGYRGTAELKVGGIVAWSLYKNDKDWRFNSDLIE